MSQIPVFDQLLQAAAAQPEPQRLLFVFASADLPDDATAAQRASHAAGNGGTLTPLMCVDKAPAELASFAALLEESGRAGPPWQVVFAAALPGIAGAPPAPASITEALRMMVDRVRSGNLGTLLAIDRDGNTVEFL